MIGIEPRWGVAGLTSSAGVAGWVEYALLRRGLRRRLGAMPSIANLIAKLWGAAACAVLVGSAARFTTLPDSPVPRAIVILGAYGLVYLGITVSFTEHAARLLKRARSLLA